MLKPIESGSFIPTFSRQIVGRSGDRDLSFEGALIAKVRSSPNNASSDYSGRVGRWATFALYITKSENYVCEQVDHTQWDGEDEHYSAAVCKNVDQIIEFFGHSKLANELYATAEILCQEEVQ
jgi:hypothetical protein